MFHFADLYGRDGLQVLARVSWLRKALNGVEVNSRCIGGKLKNSTYLIDQLHCRSGASVV